VANIKIFLHSLMFLHLLYQSDAQHPEITLSHTVRYRFELRIGIFLPYLSYLLVIYRFMIAEEESNYGNQRISIWLENEQDSVTYDGKIWRNHTWCCGNKIRL